MANSASPFYNEGAKLFKWNWGGFLDPLGFGFAHKAYKTFLFALPCLAPIMLGALTAAGVLKSIIPALATLPLLLVWNIGCGAMGAKLAWSAGLYEDGVAFRSSMDTWNRAGKLHFVLRMSVVILIVAAVTLGRMFFWLEIQDFFVTVIPGFPI